MSGLNERERELVAIGASIASNCVPCIEHHVPVARAAGLADAQIKEAIHIADRVRRVPARKVVQAAWAKLEQSPADPGTACGCPEAAVTP